MSDIIALCLYAAGSLCFLAGSLVLLWAESEHQLVFARSKPLAMDAETVA